MTGKGKQANQTRADSQSDSASVKADATHGQQLCGTCNLDVGEDPIGCDDCQTWVHGTEMCSGLPQDVLDAILKHGGHRIKFSCMKCRLGNPQGKGKRSSGADKEMKETLQQLFRQFRGMCAVLTDLSCLVKALTQGTGAVPQPTAPAQQSAPPTPSLPTAPDRTLIRDELREMREREKRRNSIIVKGLTATGPNDAATKFSELSETQFRTKVDLAEITQIPGQSRMFRAKILSDEQRKLVLDNAKNLKGSAFSSVYITRDLTRSQRTELYEKRKARRSQSSSSGPSSAPGSGAIGVEVGGMQGTTPALPGKLTACSPATCSPDASLPVTTTTILKVAQLNLNGLSSKLHSLHSLIMSNNLKVICVTESHLLAHMPNSYFDIPSYRLLRSDSDGSVYKHGVCAYIHDSLLIDGVIAHKPNILSFHLMTYNVYIMVIYRPPSFTSLQNEELANVIANFCQGKEVIL